MAGTMMIHAGGKYVSRETVEAIPTPSADGIWHPIPHALALDEAVAGCERAKLTITRTRLALAAADSAQFFFLLDVEGPGGDDWAASIGGRSSLDKSLSYHLAAGSSVFICDNLVLSGEVEERRKHTTGILGDIPMMVDRLIDGCRKDWNRIHLDFEGWKETDLSSTDVDHVLLEAWRRGAMPISKIGRVHDEFRTPSHREFQPKTAWSLFNAFSEVQKRRSTQLTFRDTPILTTVFRDLFPVAEVVE